MNHGAKIIFARGSCPASRGHVPDCRCLSHSILEIFVDRRLGGPDLSAPVGLGRARGSVNTWRRFSEPRTGHAGVVGLLILALAIWGIYEWRHNLSEKGHEAESEMTPESLSGLIRSRPLHPDSPMASLPETPTPERVKNTPVA